eukprot:3389029-Amphidinium_carterae.1
MSVQEQASSSVEKDEGASFVIYGRKEKVINQTSSKVGHTDLAYKQTLEELEMPIHTGRSSL